MPSPKPIQRTVLKLPESLLSNNIALSLNREQATMLLKGLESLSEDQKKTVIFAKMKRDLESIVVIWDRRIKNTKLIEAENSKKR
jgi:hypothetical protein